MMSLSRQNNTSRGRSALVVATLVVVLLFAADVATKGGIRSLVRGGSAGVSSTGTQMVAAVSENGFFASRRALQEENATLKEAVAELTLRVAFLQSLERENEELRIAANIAEDFTGVAARVISSYRASPYGTFLIDAGSMRGVSTGQLVLAGDGERSFLVGRVSEVSASSALITQIFAPGAEIEALVGDAPLSIEGQGGGNGRAEVPRALEVEEGATVTMPTVRGLPIGIVGKVEESATGASQMVYVGFPINISSLHVVYVVQ